MLLPHHPGALRTLRRPTPDAPWRVLVSGCLAGVRCGVDGTDNGLGDVLRTFLALPTVHALPFCPEDHALGTPRTTPDLHGGDGVDVVAGRARVLDEHGADLTEALLRGARAMLAFALSERAELALLTDMSAACGSQVISDGARSAAERRYRRGVGVATALLLDAGVPVASQRDARTLAALRALADPSSAPPGDASDHHEHPWVRTHLPGPHPRA